MTTARLEVRVQSLEDTQRSLRELPGRMSDMEHRLDALQLQFVQLRAEMRSEFSALRETLVETNRHRRVLHEELIARIKAIDG